MRRVTCDIPSGVSTGVAEMIRNAYSPARQTANGIPRGLTSTAPILPVLEAPQLSVRCEQIFLRIHNAASSIATEDVETDWRLVPSFRYAVPFSPYGSDYEACYSTEPETFILPKNVYRLRLNKAEWMEDLLRYPERPLRGADGADAKRPDLFSRVSARPSGRYDTAIDVSA